MLFFKESRDLLDQLSLEFIRELTTIEGIPLIEPQAEIGDCLPSRLQFFDLRFGPLPDATNDKLDSGGIYLLVTWYSDIWRKKSLEN